MSSGRTVHRIALLTLLLFARSIYSFSQTTTTPAIYSADASAITATAAELRGYVNPSGRSTSMWFEWGTSSTSLTNVTEHKNAGDGTAPLPLSQTVSALQPGTAYYFRAAARSGDGAIVRADVRTFKTLTPVNTTNTTNTTSAISTGEVTAISSSSAELHGAVTPAGAVTAVWFEWGTTTGALSNQTEHRTVGDGSVSVAFGQNITQLQGAMTYYYRAVEQNSRGTLRGDARSFTTVRISTTAPEPIHEVEHGTIRSGYIIVTPDNGSSAPSALLTFAVVDGGATQSQAGIAPSPMTTDASVFIEVIPQISRNIGIALTNPGSAANTVTLTLRDDDGINVGTPATVTIPPKQQIARFVNELFGKDAVGNGFIGSLRMHSSTPFAALGLRFTGKVFSALPITVLGAVSAVPSITMTATAIDDTPKAGVIGGSDAMVLGQFALAGGWATHVALVNNTGAMISGRIDILDVSGNPLAVKLNGQTKSTFIYSIPAGGTFVLAPRDSNGQSPM